jgi:hypothetical protein
VFRRPNSAELAFTQKRPGWKVLAVSMIFLLWLLSIASFGYVSILGSIGEWWASQSGLSRLSSLLLLAGLLLVVVSPLLKRRVNLTLGGVSAFLISIGLLLSIISYVLVLNNSPSLIEVNRLNYPMSTTSSRLVPLHTAYAYAISMLQTPTHTLYEDETYIYYDESGHVIYNWVIEPEGFWNEVSREPLGVVLVNGSVYPPKVYVIKHDLFWGLHRLLLNPLYVDGLWREVKIRSGLTSRVLMDCNVEVLYQGEPYILIPITSWKVTWLGSVPYPVGYAVISANGSIKIFSMKDAAKSPLFRGVPLVPDVVAREWVDIYRYYTGVLNVILYHNTYTIRDVGTNPQPYLMTDGEGHLYWVFIAEPPGETYSAKYIFYVNASDSSPHIMVYELPKPVLGISKLSSLIKQAHPTYDWGEFMVEEPMPIILNGTLYWKVTVITKDGRGLVSVDLVDTRSNEVISIKPNATIEMNDVLAFMGASKQAPTPKNTSVSAILQKIEQLKREILNQQENLKRLYGELQTLEELVRELNTSSSSG